MSKNRKIVFVVLLLIAAIALGVVVYTLTSNMLRKKAYSELKTEVFNETTETSATPTSNNEGSSDTSVEVIPEETKEPYVSPIDFDELYKINHDIYAWIDIPGTDISYPILQREDDFEYYLRRGLDELYSNDGSLFTEPGNAKDMSDFNTIIYGHNLHSLAMFGTLKYYHDLSYLEDHREIKIYTPTGEYTYSIFAAVTYSDILITYYYDFDQIEYREAFLDSLFDVRDMNSITMDDIEVTADDRILTLSTCNDGDNTRRFLVVAVLVDVKE